MSKHQAFFETTYRDSTAQTIFQFLKMNSPISARSLRKYFFKGLVLINHKKAHSEKVLRSGDRVVVLPMTEEASPIQPEPVPIDIIYQNDDLLIINKPAGMAVHPVKTITSGTLANAVAYYYQANNIRSKVRPVHRLDVGTSGLVLFAKHAASQETLTKGINDHTIQRIYYAMVHGIPGPPTGTIDLPIGEIRRGRGVTANGQPARTHYKTVAQYHDSALLELELETGRTHQIRIHLQALGHPILGDPVYGIKSPYIKRPALHAGKLHFDHSDLPIPTVTAAWPEDFEALIYQLKHLTE